MSSVREPARLRANATPTLTAVMPITVSLRRAVTPLGPARKNRCSARLNSIRSVGVMATPTATHALLPRQELTWSAREPASWKSHAIQTLTATMPITAFPRTGATHRVSARRDRRSAPANSAPYVAAMGGPMEMPVRQPQRE